MIETPGVGGLVQHVDRDRAGIFAGEDERGVALGSVKAVDGTRVASGFGGEPELLGVAANHHHRVRHVRRWRVLPDDLDIELRQPGLDAFDDREDERFVDRETGVDHRGLEA